MDLEQVGECGVQGVDTCEARRSANEVDPSVEYTRLLEAGHDPLQAWESSYGRVGQGEAQLEAPDPAVRYTELLESGLNNLQAFQVAYEGRGVDDVMDLKDPYIAGPCFLFDFNTTLPERVVAKDAAAELIRDGKGDPFVTWGAQGPYLTCLYRVNYIGQYTDRDGHTQEVNPAFTVMRMNIPCVLADDAPCVGLVVFVNGGGVAGAENLEEVPSDSQNDAPAGVLAGAVDVADAMPLGETFGRSGFPVYTAAFTRPGRGATENWQFPDSRLKIAIDLRATGNPAFTYNPADPDSTGWTPKNLSGDDYMGDLSLNAMDGVVNCAAAIARNIEEQRGTSSSLPWRFVVASFSAGLILASRWIAERSQLVSEDERPRVHALVDCEGPVDSWDLTPAKEHMDPWGLEIGADVYDQDAFGVQAWINTRFLGCEAYWMRPPVGVLEEFSSFIPQWVTGFSDKCGLLGAMPEGWRAAWDRWYGASDWGTERLANTREELLEFWEKRNAATYLRQLPAGCAYVRVQMQWDHSFSREDVSKRYRGYHGVKALHAAFEAVPGCVYYADIQYAQDSHGSFTDPAQMTHMFSVTNPLITGWPQWIPSAVYRADSREDIRIDMIRWVLEREFECESAAHLLAVDAGGEQGIDMPDTGESLEQEPLPLEDGWPGKTGGQ